MNFTRTNTRINLIFQSDQSYIYLYSNTVSNSRQNGISKVKHAKFKFTSAKTCKNRINYSYIQ